MRNSSKIIFIICSIMLISGICLRLTLPSSTPLRLKQQPPTQSILLLPLDSRPVCSTMVQKLGALAGLNVILPPKACLDNYRTPSDRQKLLQWLQTNQPKYDYSIISADNLLHGGLLAARMNTATPTEEDALLKQLQQFAPAKHFFNKRIYAQVRMIQMFVDETDNPVQQVFIGLRLCAERGAECGEV